MSNYTASNAASRLASIAIKKNRVKVYFDETVYLKDKQEFEIELFNPSTSTRLAKISINGKLISLTGIVLKPGERVYLERYIDSSDKFRFDTYKVDGSPESQSAIRDNGKITVQFFDEYIPLPNISWTTNSYGDLTRYSTTGGTVIYTTNTSGGMTSMDSFFSSTEPVCMASDSLRKSSLNTEKEKETGRVEKGSESEQKFDVYNGSFNSYACATVSIKLLPFSQKPLEKADIVSYCTRCGTKNKANKWKFCPKCGTKF